MSPLLECKRKALAYRETFSLRTQDAWEYEFDTLIQGNGMLQGTSNCVMLSSKYKELEKKDVMCLPFHSGFPEETPEV